MNEVLEEIVREHAPEAGTLALSFIKFNTAGSPTRSNPKVLFFVFVGNGREPRFVIKTVRAARDNAVIAHGFRNLQDLARINVALFSHPLWAGEVDGIAYSIETAVPGVRATAGDIDRIVAAYIGFAKSTAKNSVPKDSRTCAEELLSELKLSSEEHSAFGDMLKRLGTTPEVMLLPQHGDLTQDNVLVSSKAVAFVDTDWYMPQGIAGFDMFHLLKRSDAKGDIAGYLRAYREAIGMERAFGEADLFLWYLQERVLKQRQGSPRSTEEPLAGFERLRAQFPFA